MAPEISSHAMATAYTLGIICALPLERTAVEAILDTQHDEIPNSPGDRNVYSLGTTGRHNVAIASLGAGSYGTVSAGGVANDMRRSFPSIKYGLMVGIAGGVPQPELDIRLGDVVVGCVNGVPSVINYRLGKETSVDFEIRSELPPPPIGLQRAVSALQTYHQRHGPTYLLQLQDMFAKNPRLDTPRICMDYYNQPEAEDVLLQADTIQTSGLSDRKSRNDGVVVRDKRFLRLPPSGLDLGSVKFVKTRDDGFSDYPTVHYGTIASADTLIKTSIERGAVYQRVKTQRRANILCFEMEAAGIVESWPCLVIRGICDYSDSHKNDKWQNFAAATAAAYAKDLLLHLPSEAVAEAPKANDAISQGQTPQLVNSGAGSLYVNLGSGSQRNYAQIGGSNNRQFNS